MIRTIPPSEPSVSETPMPKIDERAPSSSSLCDDWSFAASVDRNEDEINDYILLRDGLNEVPRSHLVFGVAYRSGRKAS